LQFGHHNHCWNHISVSIRIYQLSLAVSLDHPLINSRLFSAAIKHFVHTVPSHSMDLYSKLMFHFLVLILGLLSQGRIITGYVPSSDFEVCTACYYHLVFIVIDVNHIEKHILVISYNHFFLMDLLLTSLLPFSHRSLYYKRLLV